MKYKRDCALGFYFFELYGLSICLPMQIKSDEESFFYVMACNQTEKAFDSSGVTGPRALLHAQTTALKSRLNRIGSNIKYIILLISPPSSCFGALISRRTMALNFDYDAQVSTYFAFRFTPNTCDCL